jgi:hypothetical protein
MSLIIKGLTPGLTEKGKIKCGEKGRMITSKQGNQFQPPQKLDHFRVVTLDRGPDGNYLIDQSIHRKYGDRPRSLPVRLLYDDIELNFQARYTCFLGKTLWCYGDGERAHRIVNLQANDGVRAEVACPCGRQEPTYQKQDKCKINAKLSVIIDGTETVGGVWTLRTTSYNSTVGILSSLVLIKRLTGGPLAGIPFNLTLSPKVGVNPITGQAVTVYVVGIEYAGTIESLQQIAYQGAQRQAIHAVRIEQIEEQARKLITGSCAVDVEAEASEIVEEFFPEQITASSSGPTPQPTQDIAHQDYIETPSAEIPAVNEEPAPAPAEPQRRRRANRFDVDPAQWGGEPKLLTCGSTPDQLLAIKNATAHGEPIKALVRAALSKTGYDQLSYLTHPEAEELLAQIAAAGNGNAQAPAQQQPPAQAQSDDIPKDLVDCYISGDRMSMSRYCLAGKCQDRESGGGFCPVVDSVDEGGLL